MEAAAWNADETIITAGQKKLSSDRNGPPLAPLHSYRKKSMTKKNTKTNQVEHNTTKKAMSIQLIHHKQFSVCIFPSSCLAFILYLVGVSGMFSVTCNWKLRIHKQYVMPNFYGTKCHWDYLAQTEIAHANSLIACTSYDKPMCLYNSQCDLNKSKFNKHWCWIISKKNNGVE